MDVSALCLSSEGLCTWKQQQQQLMGALPGTKDFLGVGRAAAASTTRSQSRVRGQGNVQRGRFGASHASGISWKAQEQFRNLKNGGVCGLCSHRADRSRETYSSISSLCCIKGTKE